MDASTRARTVDEAALAARAAVNNGAYELALGFYDEAVTMLTRDAARDADADADADARDDGARRRAVMCANASACSFALGKYDDALRRAEASIASDGTYAKAHARRAEAFEATREYARARESLRTCRELLEGEGRAGERMLAELDEMVMDLDKAEAAGAQAARVGLQMKMSAARLARPSFASDDARVARTARRVTFEPTLDIDCDTDEDSPPVKRVTTKPMLVDLGALAVEKAMEMHRAGAADGDESFGHKRCKMCGNVCHVKMTSCSSCCFPLVAPDSYEPATLPRVGEDAGLYETDSSDEEDVDCGRSSLGDDVIDDASDENDPWWVRHFTRAALEPPRYAKGCDPALRCSYDALKVPVGTDELAVRAAYREAVSVSHPDAGGSSKELKTIHRAYDAIALDFWRHDEGASRLRSYAENEDIFVVLDVYRNCEAEHTLKRLFSRAKYPERVFVGVCWQYKCKTPPPDSLGARIDRLHLSVNMLTEEITTEAGKIKDGTQQEKYLKQMRRYQLKALREQDEKEKRCHSRKTLDVQFREHVREVHVPWDASEGPCYAKHLAMRKWGGEKYVLHIDAMTCVDEGWDETLIAELGRCGSDKSVLTAAPLEYSLKRQDVLEEETLTKKYETFVYGTVKERVPGVNSHEAIDPSRAPAITCAREFGESMCHMYARQLVEVPISPAPTLFVNSLFSFARAEAFVRDAPPDAHAPFLHLGEELGATARLWSRGWELFAPTRLPLLHCYSHVKRAMWMEDQRSGTLLYAERRFRIGNESEYDQREFLNLTSRRRVLQLVCAPDENSATSSDEPIEFTKMYGVGEERTMEAFYEHVGIDFKTRDISVKAKHGGFVAGKFQSNSSLLPSMWRGSQGNYFGGVGPSEFARWT